MCKNKIIITCFSKSGNTLALFIYFVYTGNITVNSNVINTKMQFSELYCFCKKNVVLRIVVCRKEDKHTGTARCNDGDNSEGMKKEECRMTTISFPVIQIEKTGKRLRNMRKESGIRVAALCEYMGGISEQAVYKWERGACLPTIDNLLALSHLYHVQMEDLLVYEEAEMASSCFISEYRGDISGTVSGYACTAA